MSNIVRAHVDVETRSAVDLKKAGMFRYFEDSSTDFWTLSYAIGDGDVLRWKPGMDCPHELGMHIENGLPVVAHNAGFERQAFLKKLGPKYGWPVPHLEQFECTAAAAAAMALPRDLGGVAAALGLPDQKDQLGKRIMLQLSKPREIKTDGTILWWDTHPDGPAKLEILYAYCDQDVRTERAAEKCIRPLSEFERRVWILDQKINERGVPVDVANVQHARWVLYHHTERLSERLRILTGGAVQSGSQVAKLRAWLNQNGVDCEKLDQKAIKLALAGLNEEDAEWITYVGAINEAKGPAREVLKIRQELSKASTKKLNAFEDRCSQDKRARDNLKYAAASTLRWGGVGIQLQNLPRQQTKKITVDGKLKPVELISKKEIEWAFDLLKHRDPMVFENTLGPAPIVISDMMKGFIKAPPGRKFWKADYSNIEGRVAAWLAEENWKIEAFHKQDRKEGPEIYLLTAAKIFHVDPATLNKESPERQLGKVAELACQFAGSTGAFQAMAGVYDVTIPNSEAKAIVEEWRDAHPAIVKYWKRLEDAAIHVVRHGGKAVVGKVAFGFKTGFMWARKPNGEFLCYVDPRIRVTRRIINPDTGDARNEVADKDGIFRNSPYTDDLFVQQAEKAAGRGVWHIQVPEHEAVTVMGVNSQTRKWERTGIHGGLIFENFVQGIARDIMVNGMFNIEAAGYPIILTIHDEIISEVASDFGSKAEFERLMVEPAQWMAGLPIRAEADECYRYRK